MRVLAKTGTTISYRFIPLHFLKPIIASPSLCMLLVVHLGSEGRSASQTVNLDLEAGITATRV